MNVVPVPSDSEGLRADLLAEALSKTPAARRKVWHRKGKERVGGNKGIERGRRMGIEG